MLTSSLGHIKEETKAIITKQRARAKKEKAKLRKDQSKQGNDPVLTSRRAVATMLRKRVSFA